MSVFTLLFRVLLRFGFIYPFECLFDIECLVALDSSRDWDTLAIDPRRSLKFISQSKVPHTILVVSLSVFQAGSYVKDHHQNGTNSRPTWHAYIRVGVWHCNTTAYECIFVNQ